MLVLSRKPRGRVIVKLADGRQVVIEVLEINRQQVRLGFLAPRDVEIMREELVAPAGGDGAGAS